MDVQYINLRRKKERKISLTTEMCLIKKSISKIFRPENIIPSETPHHFQSNYEYID